jgi:hypothetical protein
MTWRLPSMAERVSHYIGRFTAKNYNTNYNSSLFVGIVYRERRIAAENNY